MSKKIDPKTFDKYFSASDDEKSGYEVKSSVLKQNTELFNDADNKPGAIIRVKRKVKKGEESWEIFQNKTVILVLPANKFSKKQQEFFRTPDGFSFLIFGAKEGWNTIVDFKKNAQKKFGDE